MAIRIISRSDELFQDRQEAGRLLAGELKQFGGGKTVVVGIPRGGVIVAREIARELGAEFDIVLAHKLGSPGNAELAIGSVSEDGRVFVNERLVRNLGVNDSYIETEKVRQLVELRRRAALVRRVRPKVALSCKRVIICDDGVATGATAQAAIWSVRLEEPSTLILALPVGPEETLRKLAEDVDEMICLRAPCDFAGVGQFYLHFDPVQDEVVVSILKQAP